MSRTAVFIIIILASAGIVLASVGIKTFFPSVLNKQNLSATPQPSKKASAVGNPLPIRLVNPTVKAAVTQYVLEGKLKSIQTIPQGTELITSINGPKKPMFVVTNKTALIFNNKNRITAAKISDLKSGQKLRITATFDLKKRFWTTQKVAILIGTFASASPSAKPK